MLFNAIKHLDQLPAVDRCLVEQISTKRSVRKHYFISRESEVIEHFVIVLEGVFKVSSQTPCGRIVIHGFLQPGDGIFDMAALVDKRAKVTVQAVASGLVLIVPYAAYFQEMQARVSLQRFAMTFISESATQSLRREQQFLALHAADRYLKFVEERPLAAQTVARTEIASYIGVTPESLSRIVSGLRRKKSQSSESFLGDAVP